MCEEGNAKFSFMKTNVSSVGRWEQRGPRGEEAQHQLPVEVVRAGLGGVNGKRKTDASGGIDTWEMPSILSQQGHALSDATALPRRLESRGQTVTSVGGNVEKSEPSYTAGGRETS